MGSSLTQCLQVVMDMLDSLLPGGKAAECLEARHDYRDAYLPCFHRRAAASTAHWPSLLLDITHQTVTTARRPCGDCVIQDDLAPTSSSG